MKLAALALVLVALFAVVFFCSRSREASPEPTPELASLDDSLPRGDVVPPSRPQPVSGPDGTAALLERLDLALSKLENLEVGVRDARTEITLRTQERSRTPVTVAPVNVAGGLTEQDLESLRALVREELVNEAWRQRQEELVGIARHLAVTLALETKTIDPLIEVLCTNGRTLFDLERELAAANHERGLAKRRAPDFRLARRRLRDDIGSIYRDEELAARVFLHVASHGEVPALDLNRERLFAAEKEWLR